IIRFFFPCGRRDTIFSRDWSSDVCSSDLAEGPTMRQCTSCWGLPFWPLLPLELPLAGVALIRSSLRSRPPQNVIRPLLPLTTRKIGRASCRERVDVAEVVV